MDLFTNVDFPSQSNLGFFGQVLLECRDQKVGKTHFMHLEHFFSFTYLFLIVI